MTLREARERAKLTQEELEALSGVNQATISNLEIGRIQRPLWDTVRKLCAALGVEPEDVFPVDTKVSR